MISCWSNPGQNMDVKLNTYLIIIFQHHKMQNIFKYNLLFWCINPYEIRKILAKPVAVIVSSGWTMFGSGYENCPEFGTKQHSLVLLLQYAYLFRNLLQSEWDINGQRSATLHANTHSDPRWDRLSVLKSGSKVQSVVL